MSRFRFVQEKRISRAEGEGCEDVTHYLPVGGEQSPGLEKVVQGTLRRESCRLRVVLLGMEPDHPAAPGFLDTAVGTVVENPQDGALPCAVRPDDGIDPRRKVYVPGVPNAMPVGCTEAQGCYHEPIVTKLER